MAESISQELKRCSRCTSTKLLETYFSKNVKGEYKKTCDNCRLQKKAHNNKNKEKIAETNKKWRGKNKEKIAETLKKYYQENKEELLETRKKYCDYKRHHCEHNIQKRACKICCPNGYLRAVVSSRIHGALKSNKLKKSLEYLGCDIETFRTHIEKTFKENMTWDNHGFGDDCWNIDHIIPVLYKQDNIEPSIEEVGKRLHYTNTQAMWQLENFSKSNRFIG